MTDYFTKWVEAIPLATQDAEVIADALIMNVFTRFGIPSEIHSDQGRNFDSALMHLLCQKLGVHKTRTTPYHPQSDGQTERFNRTIVDGIKKICIKQDQWDKVVPFILMTYRATNHAATSLTHNLLMFGRECNIPLHVAFPPPINTVDLDYHQYANKLESRLQAASDLARAQLMMSWDTMQSYTPVSRNLMILDMDKPVLVYDPSVKKGYSAKLSNCWKGPFKLVQKVTDLLYKVDFGGRKALKVIHRTHIYQPPMRPQ